jgi:hypothetical protein
VVWREHALRSGVRSVSSSMKWNGLITCHRWRSICVCVCVCVCVCYGR